MMNDSLMKTATSPPWIVGYSRGALPRAIRQRIDNYLSNVGCFRGVLF